MSEAPSLERLAAILRSLTRAARDPTEIDALLSELSSASSGAFSGTIVLRSGATNSSFVITSVRGYDSGRARSWMRWPFRRLFTRMQPRVLSHPSLRNLLALAVPLQFRTERYVVLAPIHERATGRDWESFFTVLESFSMPLDSTATSFDDAIPATPSDPAISAFHLCRGLFERVREAVEERGWTAEHSTTFRNFKGRLYEVVSDIVILDLDELADPLSAITMVHRHADSASLQVLAFGGSDSLGAVTPGLVDRTLPHEASPEEIFQSLKVLARDAGRLRRLHAAESDGVAERQAKSALTLTELAKFGASQAARIMNGWAYLVFINEFGAVSRAEFPKTAKRIFAGVPPGVFADAPRYEVRLNEPFFADVVSNDEERTAVASLRPLSGAVIPIALGGGGRGALIAFSQMRWADTATFDALSRLAATLRRRAAELQPAKVIPEFRQDRCWERIRERAVAVDVYRSPLCGIPWRYRALDDSTALLTLGLTDDEELHARLSEVGYARPGAAASLLKQWSGRSPAFAGVIDLTYQMMSYATRGFSPPLSLAGAGPVSEVPRTGDTAAGVAVVAPRIPVVVCDDTLWPWLSTHADDSNNLMQLIERETPRGLASIVTAWPPH